MLLIDKEFNIFIHEANILKRVKELGVSISADYKKEQPIFISILNGAFMFTADLIKEISIPCQLSFIKVASYAGLESTGKVTQIFGINESLEGKHLILVDDIVDTGKTMAEVSDRISKYNPASIAVAALLLKPVSFQNQMEIKYVGFTIPDDFIVGYGLDYNGFGRNLKDIYKIA